jgi:hypothetical protein
MCSCKFVYRTLRWTVDFNPTTMVLSGTKKGVVVHSQNVVQVQHAQAVLDMEARSLTQFVTLSENNSGKMAEDLFGVPNLTTETIRCQCPP